MRGESEKRRWIIFVGNVDVEWCENQVESLKYATLATVSVA